MLTIYIHIHTKHEYIYISIPFTLMNIFDNNNLLIVLFYKETKKCKSKSLHFVEMLGDLRCTARLFH